MIDGTDIMQERWDQERELRPLSQTETAGFPVLTHFGDEVDLSRTYDQEDKRRRNDKPQGLWLSDESDYGWSEWCRVESFRNTGEQVRTDFRLREGANILHLGSGAELRAFTNEWGKPIYRDYVNEIRWLDLSHEYDGILITPYSWAMRLKLPWYYSWDCASACVWNLGALKRIPTLTPPIPTARSTRMTQIKTPEQIAREVCESSNWIQPDDRHEFMDAMTAAIEADRAQRGIIEEERKG